MTDIVARALAFQAAQKANQKGVQQYNSFYEFPTIGNAGELYVDIDNNSAYYWNEKNSAYVLLISDQKQDVPLEIKKILEESILNGGNADNEY